MRAPDGRAGFTFFEVVLALALLGVSLLMLVQHSADNTRGDADRAARLVAHRTLRNEVHRLRASEPMASPAAGTFPVTYLTDRAGNRIATPRPGAQTVTISRELRCLGGAAERDNATAPPNTYGCSIADMPLAEFTIRVAFPARGSDDGTAAVEQVITVRPPAGRHGAGWSPAS